MNRLCVIVSLLFIIASWIIVGFIGWLIYYAVTVLQDNAMTRAIRFNQGDIHCGMKLLEMPDQDLPLVESRYTVECVHCLNVFSIKHSTILLRYRTGIDHCQKCHEVKIRIKNKVKATRKSNKNHKSYLYYIPEEIKDPVPWAPTDPNGLWPVY